MRIHLGAPLWVVGATLFGFLLETAAFVPPFNSHRRRGDGGIGAHRHGIAGGSSFGPPKTPHGDSSWQGSASSNNNNYDLMVQPLVELFGAENETAQEDLDYYSSVRGGSNNAQKTAGNVVKGSQATISSTTSYWKGSLQSMTKTVTKPFQSVKTRVLLLFRSKTQQQEEALMQQLKTMPVKRVEVDSSVLPAEVVQLAARRSGVLGSPLRNDNVNDFAKALKVWYSRKGYILHAVTGATLQADTATAQIAVQEPRISRAPVEITFCKEMVVDDETGDLVTFKQYKEKRVTRKTFGHDRIEKQNLNTTYVQTVGRTKPSRIASAMQLSPGRPFRWDSSRWRQISGSGIFGRILKASPESMRDGTVQLHIYATEAPARHLEYGLAKSLYTNGWEGELDFEHQNLLGGGESLGLTVRRGTKDAEPSIRLRYADDNFGLEGGYDVEVFSDYIGDQPDEAQQGDQPPDYDHDALLDRRGATVHLRNPISSNVMRHSAASASLERTATKTGLHENIGSASFSVGPFVKQLPFDARSNIGAKITAGTRLPDPLSFGGGSGDKFLVTSLKLKPYSSVTATTKQILPLGSTASSSVRRPLVLALRHSVTTSTPSLPRHEARALGNVNNIRGDAVNGRISHALVGTTELRIPIQIPSIIKTRQDAGLVVFGDWLVAAKDSQFAFYRKSCIGVGLRKSVQGIPLKCDVSFSQEGKLKTMFGLGGDFDI